MKVILSRKGFDSSCGGSPSLIYNNKLITIPIPGADSEIRYKDLIFEESINFIKVMKDLGITYYSEAHLDPDLRRSIYGKRESEWRPIFGQDQASLSILESAKIGKGDLFVFYGWFRDVINSNGTFQYKKGAKDLHVIYGYFEIDEVIDLTKEDSKIPSFCSYHPHVVLKDDYNKRSNKNTIFIASRNLSFDDSKPGAAFFNYNERLVLTDLNKKNRSSWKLPLFFKPKISNSDNTPKTDTMFNAAIKNESVVDNEFCFDFNGRNQQELLISDNNEIVNWFKSNIIESQIYD